MAFRWLHNAFRRRKAAESLSEFAALVEAPSDLGSEAAGGDAFTLVWPGNASVGISASIALDAGQVIVAGASLAAGDADAIIRGPYVHEGKVLTIVTDAALDPCSLTVYVLDEWKRARIVATATVT